MTIAIIAIMDANLATKIGAISMAYGEFKKIGSVDRVPALIAAVKAKKQRLFGFGHRIYKTVDPRTRYIRQMINEHIDESRLEEIPFLKVALEIDRIASADDYFTSRNLRANADLYGALLYTAMGFETDIIVAMAALSRVGGSMAHWREAMGQSPMLWRPQQVFTGSVTRADPETARKGVAYDAAGSHNFNTRCGNVMPVSPRLTSK